jgi:putative ABC transport system ATP-binding protein
MWMYKQDKEEIGPVSLGELQALAVSGELKPEDQVCVDLPDRRWVAAGSVGRLFPQRRVGETAPITQAALPRIGSVPEVNLDAPPRVGSQQEILLETLPRIDLPPAPNPPPRPVPPSREHSELEVDLTAIITPPGESPTEQEATQLESVPGFSLKTPVPPERMRTQMALPRIGSAPEVGLSAADEERLYEVPRPKGWYFAQSRPQRVGPISDKQLQELVKTKHLQPTDMVWLEGTPRWVPAGSVEGLAFPPGTVAPAPPDRAPTGTSVAVHCRNVTKSFGEGNAKTVVLRGVDLDIFTGMMTLMVGPSGCGKTTLMSVLAGTLEVNEGTITIFGKDLVKMGARDKVRFRGETIGFVFQQFNLLPALTSAENAAMPLLIAGWPWRKAVRKASELLAKVGMEKRLNHYPRMLSGGQQQRVAFARALVHEPRLLVCDEPTSALDAESGHAVMTLLREVAVQPQRAVMVVTHDSRIFEFSDRTVHMEDGRVVAVEEKPGLRMPLSVSSFEVRL